MNSKTYEPPDPKLGELEPSYHTDAEARIGRTLDRYDTPFFYHQPRLIYDQGYHDIWHPTFTLPTYDSLVIEYADPNSGIDYDQRQRVYRFNGIAALVAREQDLSATRWDETMMRRVHAEYQRAQAEYRHQHIHGYRRENIGCP
jgi:hypothetical protein